MRARNFTLLVALAASSPAAGQIPTVFLSTGRVVPGGAALERVSGITALARTPDGGYAVQISTVMVGQAAHQDAIFGNLMGGNGSLIRRAGSFAGFDQLFYYDSFGVGGGSVVYSPCASTGGFCDGGVWIDDVPIVVAGQPGPVAGSTWADRHWNVSATAAGEPIFIGGFESPIGSRRGLFIGNPPQPAILPGDQPALLPHPVFGVNPGLVSVSGSGAHVLAEVSQDCGSCGSYANRALLFDGQVLTIGGAPYLGLDPVPASIGGAGEAWRYLTQVEVNDAGQYAISGVTSLGSSWESYVLRDGAFFLREGEPFAGGTWREVADLHLAETGELYHIAFFEDATGALQHGVFVEDQLVYRAGDPIDWTGDGLPDAGYELLALRWSSGGIQRFGVDDDGTILLMAGVRTPNGIQREAVLRIGYGHGLRYCGAIANSTGNRARMEAFGSPLVSEANLRLRASSLPPGANGYFLVGDLRANVPGPSGSVGRLCVGGSIGRFVGPGQLQAADASGRFELVADLGALPQPSGLVPVLPGQTWNFTAWFRDHVGGAATSNFADGLAVTFR